MAVYKRGRVWWYRFTWKGEPIRETTTQTNKRVAEQIDAAHKTSLAKGEVGILGRSRISLGIATCPSQSGMFIRRNTTRGRQ